MISDATLLELARKYDQGNRATYEYDSDTLLRLLREARELRATDEEAAAVRDFRNMGEQRGERESSLPLMDEVKQLRALWSESVRLLDNMFARILLYRKMIEELVRTASEVHRISDRTHDAWVALAKALDDARAVLK